MLLNGRKETWVKFNPGLSAYRPSNNQERITKQGGQKNAKNTFATAIHTDQGPEKRCGTYIEDWTDSATLQSIFNRMFSYIFTCRRRDLTHAGRARSMSQWLSDVHQLINF